MMEDAERTLFDAYADRHPVGTKVRARVIGVRVFGAFCSLAEGVEGLLLVVDFAGDPRAMTYPNAYPRVGDVIDVWIEKLIREKGQVKLTQCPPALLHDQKP